MIGLRTKSGNVHLVLTPGQPNCTKQSEIEKSLITSFYSGRTTQCLQVLCGNEAVFLNQKELQW